MKKRILLISLRSDHGGGQKYMHDYAKSLLQLDQEIWIASPNDQPYFEHFKSISKSHFLLPHRTFSFVSFFKLLLFCKINDIEIVHSHGRGAGIYSRLLKFFGFTVFHTFHGIHKAPGIIGNLKFLVDKLINPMTDGYVFVSESEKNQALLNGLYQKKPAKIVYPIAPACWPNPKTNFSVPVQLGSIARLDHAKGIDLLLKNLSSLKVSHPETFWKLTLIGSSPGLVEIPDNIKDCVDVIGLVSNPIEYLRNFDIYIANSRWESFNLSVLEAISQGIPTLISEVPGHEYFIKSGVAIGFPAENSMVFSHKILYFLANPKPKPYFEWIEKNHRLMSLENIYLP